MADISLQDAENLYNQAIVTASDADLKLAMEPYSQAIGRVNHALWDRFIASLVIARRIHDAFKGKKLIAPESEQGFKLLRGIHNPDTRKFLNEALQASDLSRFEFGLAQAFREQLQYWVRPYFSIIDGAFSLWKIEQKMLARERTQK
jgi:hypothetical protein